MAAVSDYALGQRDLRRGQIDGPARHNVPGVVRVAGLCTGNGGKRKERKRQNGFNFQFSTFQLFNFSTTNTYPLSIFPESERRRIAADFGQPRVPVAVKRAITGAEKAMARSRKRAEKGLCTKEESDAFCAKSAAALKSYLDKQVQSGVLTPAERKALGR